MRYEERLLHNRTFYYWYPLLLVPPGRPSEAMLGPSEVDTGSIRGRYGVHPKPIFFLTGGHPEVICISIFAAATTAAVGAPSAGPRPWRRLQKIAVLANRIRYVFGRAIGVRVRPSSCVRPHLSSAGSCKEIYCEAP